MDIRSVSARFNNAIAYGTNGGNYDTTQQMVQLGKEIAVSKHNCKNFWGRLWDNIIGNADRLVDVAKFICKYKKAIMVGTVAVGVPQAVPIETAIAFAACQIGQGAECFEKAKKAINIIKDGKQCTTLLFDIKQYLRSTKMSDIITHEAGEFAGKITQSVQGCKPFLDDAKAAWSLAK